MFETLVDKVVSKLDSRLKKMTLTESAQRPVPDSGSKPDALTNAERRRSAGVMRTNHSGEVCAQALYRGQGFLARDPAVLSMLLSSAEEEQDHLNWCDQRLSELASRPSRLNPLWYTASFLIGLSIAAAGDRISLGFVHATEQQVGEHLRNCLDRLPAEDFRSRNILRKMLEEEEVHGNKALSTGGLKFPSGVAKTMGLLARLMTRTSYYI